MAMTSPATLGAQQQASQFASAAVAPNVQAHGQRLKMAAQQRTAAQQPGGMSPFASAGAPGSSMAPFASNVRTAPYAARKISAAEPQALMQLLEAFLVHHGTK